MSAIGPKRTKLSFCPGPFCPLVTQSGHFVAKSSEHRKSQPFSLFSAASDPACPKSDRMSDSCRDSLAALQAEHTFRLKFPIELAGAHSILSQPERERSKPNFYIVQFGSLGTSADGCSVKGRHTLMPLGGHRPASIEESILLRRSFCHPRLDAGLDLGDFSLIASRLCA
jgi:hypothetical protein